MELKFTIQTKINRPVTEVFDAVVDDQKIVKYFARGTTGPLRVGEVVKWSWPGHLIDVVVQKIVANELIQFEWPAADGDYQTAVEMRFEQLDPGKTMISITEGGWRSTTDGLKSSYDNCQGWQHMTTCLKAFVERDIDMR